MAPVAKDIKDMGFAPSMYGIDEAELDIRINKVIAKASGELAIKVSQSAFDDPANAEAVNAALTLMVAIEMAWRRIISLSATTTQNASEASESDSLRKAIWRWDISLTDWAASIASGRLNSGSLASGVTVSASSGRMVVPRS